MILFHAVFALAVFVIFATLGASSGFAIFTSHLMRDMKHALIRGGHITEDDRTLKENGTTDCRVLACLVAAVWTVWNRCKTEPKNFLRLEFEDPNPEHKVGTWYLIITKKSDYNPFVQIEEQRQEIMKLKQELTEKTP